MEFGIASVAGITVIAWIVGLIWKNATRLNNRWIPVACGVIGMILGVVAWLTNMPDFPAQDVINAMAVGAVSGLSATGIHQIAKQLTSSAEDPSANDDTTE